MNITMLLGLFGGLGMFIYGMHIMSEGLKIVAGNKMKHYLEIMTNTNLKALLCGIIVTILVQSSSTTTVMVVGFVNASLMTLSQAAGIILGSNIGTTLMAQVIAFDISSMSLFFLGIGALLSLFARKKKMRDWGSIILGVGILFFGIVTMSSSVEPLSEDPAFIDFLLTYGKNPFFGLLVSTIMTAILQSSGAIIGLVQALALSGVFASTTGTDAIQICIPFVIGSNVGTCITAILSSFGTSNAAKDAALIHLFVNIFGALWVMALLGAINYFFPVNPIYNFIVQISGTTLINGNVIPNVARQIAMAHTLFNVANTIVLFPFINVLVKIVEHIYPPDNAEITIQLDNRLLNTPGVALGQANTELVKMSKIVRKNFGRAMDVLISYDEKRVEKINEVEDKIDDFEHAIQEYVMKISALNMSDSQHDLASYIATMSHNLERIGDHSKNLADLAFSLNEREASFTQGMIISFTDIKLKIGNMLDNVTAVLEKPDQEEIRSIIRADDTIDHYTETLRNNRIRTVQKKHKQIVSAFIYVDALTNIERVSNLSKYIADATYVLEEEVDVKPIGEVIY